MARGYFVQGPDAGGAAPQTIATVIASTTVRPRIFDAIMGSSATPADQAGNIVIGRTTTTGTAASNPTPGQTDPGDVAATATAGITHSAEPTYSAVFFGTIPLNQRASFRWVANPGFECIVPATASNCGGIKRNSSTANYVSTATLYWYE